jgi:hypothetical protein
MKAEQISRRIEQAVHVFQNPDGVTHEELRKANQIAYAFPHKVADALFPKTGGRYAALAQLVNYVNMKINAHLSRKEYRNVALAQDYEAHCERIYNQLPSFARW